MITRDELREELAVFPTRNELRTELAATRDELTQELRQELAAYPTRSELRAEYMSRTELTQALERYATKVDLSEFREETAQAFSDLRRYMEILVEDLKAWTKTLFEGTTARAEAGPTRVSPATNVQVTHRTPARVNARRRARARSE